MEYGAIVACYGVREWANGPFDHLTLGGAILSENNEKEFDDGLLSHESAHTTQWLDPLFPLRYGEGALHSLITTGDPICGNPYERAAGLEEGGYVERCRGR